MSKMCPDFFIVGAPKCGTTTIAGWLKRQDAVFLPSVKEPNYFNSDEKLFASHTDLEYFRLYKTAPRGKLLGDASPWYLSSDVALEEIVHRNPNAKFIVMIRNHLDMAMALHQQEYVSGNEDCADFAKAWQLQGERSLGSKLPAKCYSAKRLQYLSACSVGQQLERLLGLTKPGNILVISMDALRNKPSAVKRAIGSHLGIQINAHGAFPVSNSRKKWNSLVWLSLSRGIVKTKKKLNINFSLGLISRFGQSKTGRDQVCVATAASVEEKFSVDKIVLKKILDTVLNAQFVN